MTTLREFGLSAPNGRDAGARSFWFVAPYERGFRVYRLNVATLMLDVKDALGMAQSNPANPNTAYGPETNTLVREWAAREGVPAGEIPKPSSQWRAGELIPAYVLRLLVWMVYSRGQSFPLSEVVLDSVSSPPRWGERVPGARVEIDSDPIERGAPPPPPPPPPPRPNAGGGSGSSGGGSGSGSSGGGSGSSGGGSGSGSGSSGGGSGSGSSNGNANATTFPWRQVIGWSITAVALAGVGVVTVKASRVYRARAPLPPRVPVSLPPPGADPVTAKRHEAEAAATDLHAALRRGAGDAELKALARRVAELENEERRLEGEPEQNVARRAAVVLGQVREDEARAGVKGAVVQGVVKPAAKAARRFARV